MLADRQQAKLIAMPIIIARAIDLLVNIRADMGSR